MTSESKWIWLGLGLAVGLVACSPPPPAPNDAGDSGSNADGTVQMDGAVTDTPSTGDGGGMTGCAARAQRICSRMNTCAPLLFQRTYEDMTRCVDYVTDTCSAAPTLPNAGQVVDQAACDAALDNCDSFFSAANMLPAACRPQPGTVTQGNLCGVDEQCATGLYCYGATSPSCQNGSCGTPDTASSANICNMAIAQGRPDPCDRRNGFLCSQLYDATMMSTFIGDQNRYRCRSVSFGTANATCLDGTDKRCASGFLCVNRVCLAVLGENEPCDGALATRCDTRKGLSCQRVGTTPNFSCRPTPFARIGAQCGMVTEGGVTETRSCAGAVARCNSATPPVCEALKDLGEACTSSPNNCRAPYTCTGGSCQLPAAPVCP